MADLRPTPSRHWQHIVNVQGGGLFGGRAAKRTLCDVIATGVVLISDVIRTRSWETRHLHCYTVAFSNVQKNTVGGYLRNTVEKLRSHL